MQSRKEAQRIEWLRGGEAQLRGVEPAAQRREIGWVWTRERERHLAREERNIKENNDENFHLRLCARSSEQSMIAQILKESNGIRFTFTKGFGEPANTLVLLS